MTHHGEVIARARGLAVMRCRPCGFAHLAEIPDTASRDAYYQSEFWQGKKAGAKERLYEQADWWAAIHGDWLQALGKPGSLLDVGAGYGQFARTAQAAGYRVDTVEPSAEAAAELASAGPGAPLAGRWEDVTTGRWEYISALWLIEHLADPLAFLRWARVRAGRLLLVVPHDFSRAQLAANGHTAVPFWWLDETHYSYFNWFTLEVILHRAGWRMADQLTLYPIDEHLLEADYTANPALGRALYDQVTARDLGLARDARLAEYRALAAEGRGRELVAICEPF